MKIKIINSLAAAALLTGSLGVLQAEKAKSTDAKPAKAKAAKKSDRRFTTCGLHQAVRQGRRRQTERV